MHGGVGKIVAGKPLDPALLEENPDAVRKGGENLAAHLEMVRQYGVPVVVAINAFPGDAESEFEAIREVALAAGARDAVVTTHWADGGDGAVEFAEAVKEACADKARFKFLYPLETKLRDRVEKVAKVVYGAKGVTWTPEAEAKAKMLESDKKYADYATMMVKTHLSLSHDPALKGTPKGWTLPIQDVLIYSGAKFLCPMAGAISLMPGTSSNPAFRRVDVNTKTGKVKGLF